MKDIKALIRIPLTLVIICALTALVLAAVNAVTIGPIKEAEQRKKEAAIQVIFANADSVADITDNISANDKITAVYKAGKGSAVMGYAVEVQIGSGYGGDIKLMVGIDTTGKIVGVEIIEHSETAGLGAAIENDSFRNGFKGLSEYAVIGKNVDAISGATISSRAVADGVNDALDAVRKLITDNSTVTTERIETTTNAETDIEETAASGDESDTQTETSAETTADAGTAETGVTGTESGTEADGNE